MNRPDPLVTAFGVMVQATIDARRRTIPPSIRSSDAIGGWEITDVEMEEINELDTQMRKLNQSILKLKPPQEIPYHEGETSDEAQKLIAQWVEDWKRWKFVSWEWTEFFVSWRGWLDEHWGPYSRIGAKARDDFRSYQMGYDKFLKRFHQEYPEEKTDAEPYKAPAPGPDRVGQVLDVAKVAGIAALVIGGFFVLRELRSMAPASAPTT